jgi:hypothetical protein
VILLRSLGLHWLTGTCSFVCLLVCWEWNPTPHTRSASALSYTLSPSPCCVNMIRFCQAKIFHSTQAFAVLSLPSPSPPHQVLGLAEVLLHLCFNQVCMVEAIALAFVFITVEVVPGQHWQEGREVTLRVSLVSEQGWCSLQASSEHFI